MRLKPKNTTLNPRALLYRRYSDITKSFALKSLYCTIDGIFWRFNVETLAFEKTELADYTGIEIIYVSPAQIFNYLSTYFAYDNGWKEVLPNESTSLKFNNISKYQVNQYYFVGSFSYVRRGSEQGSTIQVIKGNIIPLENFEIVHFDDNINLRPDDLVVINGRLYSVENPVIDHKHQPRDYKVYSATLNSIV